MLWNRLKKGIEEEQPDGGECGENGQGGKEGTGENKRTKQSQGGKKRNQSRIRHTSGNGILAVRNRERRSVVKSLPIRKRRKAHVVLPHVYVVYEPMHKYNDELILQSRRNPEV